MELLTSELTPWHWLTIGVLMCALELFAPTTFLLWPGTAAILTGLITLLIPIHSWELQVLTFAVLAVATTLIGRIFFKRTQTATDQPSLNRLGDSYIGRRITLTEPIVNGVGSTFINKTRWRVLGPDTAGNTTMVVTGLDGASLIVEADNAAS